MSMILNNHFGMFFLDIFHQLPQHFGTSNTCHIFQADFGSPCLYQLICYAGIVLYGVNRRISNTQGSLRNHSGFLGIFYRRNNIAHFIQTAKNTSDINSLCMFHLIHQPSHISGNGIHSQCIQTTIEHMSLNTCFMQWFGKRTDCFIRVLPIK